MNAEKQGSPEIMVTPSGQTWTKVDSLISRSGNEWTFYATDVRGKKIHSAIHLNSGVTLSGSYLAPLRKRVANI